VPFQNGAVGSHICQLRADEGHPVFPPLKPKAGLNRAPKIPHLPTTGRCGAPRSPAFRVEICGIPLKPRAGLHGAPKIPHLPTTGRCGAPRLRQTTAYAQSEAMRKLHGHEGPATTTGDHPFAAKLPGCGLFGQVECQPTPCQSCTLSFSIDLGTWGECSVFPGIGDFHSSGQQRGSERHAVPIKKGIRADRVRVWPRSCPEGESSLQAVPIGRIGRQSGSQASERPPEG